MHCPTELAIVPDATHLFEEPGTLDEVSRLAMSWFTLNELAAELGDDDRQATYRILRAFLHALRDRLGVDEAAQLAAQLPLLVRGIYYEGWDPSSTPRRYREPREFLDRVADEALLHGDTEASFAVSAAAAVLRKHISAGEMDNVLQALPVPIGALLTEPPS